MARSRARLLKQLRNRLPARARRALETTVTLAEERGVAVYLVGGAVRDLLLGAKNVDVDLLVEGDALRLASRAGRKLRARIVRHPRFGTASLRGSDYRLDLAAARSEVYTRPGALPNVRPAPLQDDLARRDFTVNAMALTLSGPNAGRLIDPFDGEADVSGRLIRVLHEASFQDDATRILRAVRYAGRLEFQLDRRTAALLRRDRCYLHVISGTRLRREFELIAVESRLAQIVRSAERLGLLSAVHPALRVDADAARAAARVPELLASHRDAALFCLLLSNAVPSQADDAIGRLALTGRQATAVGSFLALRSQAATLAKSALKPSEAVRVLATRPVEAIEAFALFADQPAAERARSYLAEWRFVRPRLTGRDVVALGVAPGPHVGAALTSLRAARLDGHTATREDEVSLVEALARNGSGVRHG